MHSDICGFCCNKLELEFRRYQFNLEVRRSAFYELYQVITVPQSQLEHDPQTQINLTCRWCFRDPKQPPGVVRKPCKFDGIFNYQPQQVNDGFLNHQQHDFCWEALRLEQIVEASTPGKVARLVHKDLHGNLRRFQEGDVSMSSFGKMRVRRWRFISYLYLLNILVWLYMICIV